jgi:hypothetical protein
MEDSGALFAGGAVLITIIVSIVSIAATVIPLIFLFKFLAKNSAKNQQLMATGIPAQARVIQMGPTGMTINDAPQMNLVLEVYPPPNVGYRGGSAPFTANVQALVPVYVMPRVQPGSTVAVRFDPNNPMNVALDMRAMGFA